MAFKDFTAGEILTAQDIDTFLMRQTVMVFDDDTDRSTSLGTFVVEGMLTYLKDLDKLQAYDGSVWGPIGEDAFTVQGTAGYILASNGTAGIVWQDNGTPGQAIISNGTAGIVAENTISPLLLLGV